MDREVIQEKLESLRRCLERLQQKCPKQKEILHADLDLQDIIAVNLTRAVQTSVDIAAHIISATELETPATMSGLFTSLAELGMIDVQVAERMRKSVGFRNIAVHNYDEIDWDIVYNICTQHLDDFKRFAKAMSKQLIA